MISISRFTKTPEETIGRLWRHSRYGIFDKCKIFCLSMQKTGTTSVNQFFHDAGYPVAGWGTSHQNGWTRLWCDGNYEPIFRSLSFRAHKVFEDEPWFCRDFYKYLFYRFPESKFILFSRDPEAWYCSMLNHAKSGRRKPGYTTGNTYVHAKNYRREMEFLEKFGDDYDFKDQRDYLLPMNEAHKDHYIRAYRTRNLEVRNFFSKKDPSRLFSCSLEDTGKWKKMGEFFGMDVPNDDGPYANKTDVS